MDMLDTYVLKTCIRYKLRKDATRKRFTVYMINDDSCCIAWYGYIVCVFVCVCVCLCVPYLLRGPLTDLRQTWYVGGPPICP